MMQSEENLVTDGQTDRTNESNIIERCPSNVERPKRKF